MDAVTYAVGRGTGMNLLFGVCMGAIISRLVKQEEYWYAVLAIIAFAIYILTICGTV